MASAGDSRGESKSPKQSNNSPPPQLESQASEPKQTDVTLKPESSSTNAEPTKPLAPPPRPGQQQGGNTPDYFASQLGGSLSLEPNPFEQSFGAPTPETPGGTKLPSVAALTSPSSLLPGSGVTPFAWGGGSLRTGPLSPAMLSGPTNDYFGDTHHMRGGFPTPNESSMRTGLTPGGGGSMFPAPSPNSQALFAQLASNGATPGTLDFHRTAMNAAAVKRDQQSQAQQPSVTSQPQDMPNGVAPAKPEAKAPAGHFDPHDNDAANGLFLLAQGRNNAQSQTQYTMAPQQQLHAQPVAVPAPQANMSPQMANGNPSLAGSSARGASESGSAGSDESQQARPNTRGKGKRNSTAGTATTNGRRKADDAPAKGPANKKAKTNGANAPPSANSMDFDHSDDDDDDDDDGNKHDEGGSKSKMTDEEKRKNFLERNR
ncbi:Aft1 HRA domain-containing protein [Phialemonium atrogriseum]|uniref:Aft1 HRA domain-containing protein n=1 Tax=Phialemonium atrogriseum TaxID=1093897 RepID=A0AAJ0C6H2_9PEZI|nr:Aft1 HRA domain-containing protein [Phialemonium atrogriseum]KAK1771053.1 Aft1 HRA domain-containing protein [Phialemonium atrogriseum]